MSLQNTTNKHTTYGSANIYLCSSFDFSKLDTEITTKLTEENLLAVTDDGTNFEEVKEVSYTDLAGFNGKKVKGWGQITGGEGKINATGRLVNNKLLESSLYQKETNSSTKYEVWGVKEGIIADGMYKDVVMVAVNKAKEIAELIVLKNAYNESLSIESKSKEDGTCKLEFVSNYSLDVLDDIPYRVITLKDTIA